MKKAIIPIISIFLIYLITLLYYFYPSLELLGVLGIYLVVFLLIQIIFMVINYKKVDISFLVRLAFFAKLGLSIYFIFNFIILFVGALYQHFLVEY